MDGLSAIADEATEQRDAIILALRAVATDRNPRLAKKAQELLRDVYKAAPR